LTSRVAIVLHLPEKLCQEHNSQRPDRNFGPHVFRQQNAQLRRSLHGLKREGFSNVYVLSSLEEIAAAEIERQPLWCNRKDEHGPFDIIADVHGCYEELRELLAKLGYEIAEQEENGYGMRYHAAHPQGRKAVFLSDLVDRWPAVPLVLRLVMDMVEEGVALCLPGNHDMKLLRKLQGRDVRIAHGLAGSGDCLPGRGRGAQAFRRHWRGQRHLLHAHGSSFL
jgi:protein phosphatase